MTQITMRVWSISQSQTSLPITNTWTLLKLMSIESVMPSDHFILCYPLLFLPLIFPSIRGFSNELVLHIRQTKYWRFSFNISPSNECSELISFRIDQLDLLAVQRTLKSLLQHHSSKALILRHSAFFGEGKGNLLQYSCLENPMDGGAWWAEVHGVTKSRARLSN